MNAVCMSLEGTCAFDTMRRTSTTNVQSRPRLRPQTVEDLHISKAMDECVLVSRKHIYVTLALKGQDAARVMADG